MLSGPAGGVVGYAMTSYQHDTMKPVIGFDMGGEVEYCVIIGCGVCECGEHRLTTSRLRYSITHQ